MKFMDSIETENIWMMMNIMTSIVVAVLLIITIPIWIIPFIVFNVRGKK